MVKDFGANTCLCGSPCVVEFVSPVDRKQLGFCPGYAHKVRLTFHLHPVIGVGQAAGKRLDMGSFSLPVGNLLHNFIDGDRHAVLRRGGR